MWDFIVDFVENNTPLSVFLGAALLLLTVAAVARAVSLDVGAYFGVGAVLTGGYLLFFLAYPERARRDFFWTLALVLIYGGVSYLLFAFLGWLIRKRNKKRATVAERRALQYVLPTQNGDYVRARLRTMAAEEEICPSAQSRESFPTELAYARELLSKVREKELSATDALQAEELGKLFALYGRKEGFSYADVRTVNEGFCCLLKLAAKYTVEP